MKKLDELIELESYELVKITNNSIEAANKYRFAAFDLYIIGKDTTIELFKHKHEDSYLIIVISVITKKNTFTLKIF